MRVHELMELIEEMTLKELGESELERLVRGWRREARSWFQRLEEAYWKERSVIRREDDVDGRASVTKDEERVLRGGWTVMRLCRYEGWVVVRTFVGKWEELVFNALVFCDFVLRWACLCLSLSPRISHAYLTDHNISDACCRCPWLDPPLAALWYVMHFWFHG